MQTKRIRLPEGTFKKDDPSIVEYRFDSQKGTINGQSYTATVHQWTMKTLLRLRARYTYTKRAGLDGGWLRQFDHNDCVVKEGMVSSDTEAVKEIATMCLNLTDQLRVNWWHPDPVEKDLSRQFADLLVRMRRGDRATGMFNLPLAVAGQRSQD